MANGLDGGQITMFSDRLQMFGLGSKLDVKAMLDAEMKILELRSKPYESQKALLAAQKELWSTFRSALNTFTSNVDKLRKLNVDSKQVTFSDKDVATAKAGPGAIDSRYSLSVQSLATRHRLMSDQQSKEALGYDGVVQISGKDLKITSDMGLKEIANAINKGAYTADAVVLDGRLVLTAKKSGSDNSLTFTDTDAANRVISSDITSVVGKITGDVTDGSSSLSVEVQQLAQAHKIQSGALSDKTAKMGFSGSFTINGKKITVESSDTITSISKKITDADVGVKSSVDTNGRLTLEAKETGGSKAVVLVDSTNDGTSKLFDKIGLTSGGTFRNVITEAQDAMYTVNGVSYTSESNAASGAIEGIELQLKATTEGPVSISVEGGTSTIWEDLGILQGTDIKNIMESPKDAKYTLNGIELTNASNTITDIDGVSITLLKETVAPVSVTVQQSTDAVKEQLREFVKSYNTIIMNVNKLTAKEGALQGETLMNQLKRKMGDVLMKKTDSPLYLFDLGIKLDRDAKDGTIKFDESVYNKVAEDRQGDIMTLIAGTNSFGNNLYDVLNSYAKATGPITGKITSIDSKIKRADDTLDKLDRQFERQKETYLKKYAMLEITLSSLNLQADYMKGQLQALMGGNQNS